MSKLFQSRKFLLVVLDAGVAIVTVVVAQFLTEDWVTFSASIIAPVTAVLTALIFAIAVEDAAALKAGSHPNQG